MERRRYDLNFKKLVVAKGKEIGNMTAAARRHEIWSATIKLQSRNTLL